MDVEDKVLQMASISTISSTTEEVTSLRIVEKVEVVLPPNSLVDKVLQTTSTPTASRVRRTLEEARIFKVSNSLMDNFLHKSMGHELMEGIRKSMGGIRIFKVSNSLTGNFFNKTVVNLLNKSMGGIPRPKYSLLVIRIVHLIQMMTTATTIRVADQIILTIH